MMERQKAGFVYQEKVIQRYNLLEDENYTGKWDAYYKNIPVSIKLEKYGSDIELADIFRQMDIKENFYLICGFWKNQKNNIIEEHLLYFDWKKYNKYFNLEMKKDFRVLLASITNRKEDDIKWRKSIYELKNKWHDTTPNLIRPRFKRDHKTQKRIQCAINNKDFYSHFLTNYEVKSFERDNKISWKKR